MFPAVVTETGPDDKEQESITGAGIDSMGDRDWFGGKVVAILEECCDDDTPIAVDEVLVVVVGVVAS